MKKILFLMHVPWGWIKQRPHFIAEELTKDYKLILLSDDYISLDEEIKKNKNVKVVKYWRIPFKTTITFLQTCSFIIKQIQLWFLLKKCDIIWLNYPNHFSYFKRFNLKRYILVYDCMDDTPEFFQEPTRSIIMQLEKKLCDQANIVFVSSKNLGQKLEERYFRTDTILVNNAMKDNFNLKHIGLPNDLKQVFDFSGKKIIYLGTISSWFNFDLLLQASNKFPDIRFYLIGPKEVPVPESKRIHWIPPVQHDYILSVMGLADLLIMPFHINELVKGINPVKVYEYIYSGKPILLTKYEETEAFDEFVYLYETENEFNKYMLALTDDKLKAKKEQEHCIEYANGNTWTDRVSIMKKTLERKLAT